MTFGHDQIVRLIDNILRSAMETFRNDKELYQNIK